MKQKAEELVQELKESLLLGDQKRAKALSIEISYLSKQISTLDPSYTPKYKTNDLVVLKMNDYKAIFLITTISTNNKGVPYYVLKGQKIIEEYKENKFKTEFKKYNPFCEVIDEKMTLLSSSDYLN